MRDRGEAAAGFNDFSLLVGLGQKAIHLGFAVGIFLGKRRGLACGNLGRGFCLFRVFRVGGFDGFGLCLRFGLFCGLGFKLGCEDVGGDIFGLSFGQGVVFRRLGFGFRLFGDDRIAQNQHVLRLERCGCRGCLGLFRFGRGGLVLRQNQRRVDRLVFQIGKVDIGQLQVFVNICLRNRLFRDFVSRLDFGAGEEVLHLQRGEFAHEISFGFGREAPRHPTVAITFVLRLRLLCLRRDRSRAGLLRRFAQFGRQTCGEVVILGFCFQLGLGFHLLLGFGSHFGCLLRAVALDLLGSRDRLILCTVCHGRVVGLRRKLFRSVRCNLRSRGFDRFAAAHLDHTRAHSRRGGRVGLNGGISRGLFGLVLGLLNRFLFGRTEFFGCGLECGDALGTLGRTARAAVCLTALHVIVGGAKRGFGFVGSVLFRGNGFGCYDVFGFGLLRFGDGRFLGDDVFASNFRYFFVFFRNLFERGVCRGFFCHLRLGHLGLGLRGFGGFGFDFLGAQRAGNVEVIAEIFRFARRFGLEAVQKPLGDGNGLVFLGEAICLNHAGAGHGFADALQLGGDGFRLREACFGFGVMRRNLGFGLRCDRFGRGCRLGRLGDLRLHGRFGGRRSFLRRVRRHQRLFLSGCGRLVGCSLATQKGVLLAQNHAVFLNFCFDPALNFALSDTVKHLRIRLGRLCTEIPVVGSQIAEILRNRLHRVERLVKSFQGARKGAVGYGQDLARTNHGPLAFYWTSMRRHSCPTGSFAWTKEGI